MSDALDYMNQFAKWPEPPQFDGKWAAALGAACDELAEKDARIASLEAEVERLKAKWESGEEWYIYNRDRNDARIRGPYSSNIIASAVRDEMEAHGKYCNDNLAIMTEPKKEPTNAQ